MATKVLMPEMGEGVTEATIIQWLKQEGDTIEELEPLLEVNTDKVDTEIPSPVSGTVLKTLHAPDTVVAVHEILAWIGEPGEDIPEADTSAPPPPPEKKEPAPLAAQPAAPAPATPKPAQPAAPPPAPRGDWLKGAVSPLAARVAAAHKVDPARVQGTGQGGLVTKRDIMEYVRTGGANTVPGAPAPAPGGPHSGFISPLVARLSSEHKIDLRQVTGTGKDGRITKYDIERVLASGGRDPMAAAAPTALDSPLAPQPPRPGFEGLQPGTVMKMTPVRRSIAKHMVESRHTSPHVSTFMEIDMNAVAAHRAENKAAYADKGVKLTFTAYFVTAAAAALKTYPVVNSSWSDDGIILHEAVNIGMAVSLDADGLIVPVIKNVQKMSLMEIARSVNDLAGRARGKALQPDEVRGGTFTITNHGTSGSLFATPIINQPQCAILGTGAIQKRVVAVGDSIAVRPMVYVGLTFDHRILDGAVADYFLGTIKQTLEDWNH